jgi:hypothetical protein
MLHALCLIAATIVCGLALPSCHRASGDEARLIGTWEYTTVDAVGRLRFDGDHKVALWFVESPTDGVEPKDALWGTWRIEGDQVLLDMDYESRFKDLGPPYLERKGKTPLAQFDRSAQKTTDRPYFVLIRE